MDDEKSIRQIIREELEKLSKLTWGQRFGYVWDYYKPLMVAVIVIISLISLGITIYHNLQLNHLLSVFMVNSNSLEINTDEIIDQFSEQIGGIGEKDVIQLDTSVFLSDEGTEYSMANQVKITAMVSSSEVDILVMDVVKFEEYAAQGYFMDLSTVLSEEQMEKWSDILLTDRETGVVYGIELTQAPVLTRYNAYFGEPAYGGIPLNSKRLELCDDFLEYLLSDGTVPETDLIPETEPVAE